MLVKRRCIYQLVTVLALCGSSLSASVGYIVNCCNHSSTVSVFNSTTGQQTAEWITGEGAADVVLSPDGSRAYVSNSASDSISVIEVATGEALATIPVGYGITWLTITKDGTRVYGESYDYAYESHIVEVDATTNTLVQAVGFAASFSPLVVSPDGTKLYVDAAFSTQTGLWVIDATSLTLTTVVPMGASNGVAVTPDGKFVYVPNLGPGGPYMPQVDVVDTSTNTISATIPLSPKLNPSNTQISPDGSMLWVSEFALYNTVPSEVLVISTATNQISGHIHLAAGSPGAIAFGPSGKVAYVAVGGSGVDEFTVASLQPVRSFESLGPVSGLAVTADGKNLILPNGGSSEAAAFTESHLKNLSNIPVGSMPSNTPQLPYEVGGAASSADGSRVYVTNYNSNNVSIIDTAFKKVITSVPTGASPVGVAVAPDGAHAYVANSFGNSVTVVDTGSYSATNIAMPAFSYPTSIAVSPDGARVYITGSNIVPDFGNSPCYLFVLDTSSNKVVDSIRVPYPTAVAVSPDGAHVYVSGGTTAGLYTISTATDTVTGSLQVASNGLQPPGTTGLAITADGTHAYLDDGADDKIFEIDLATNKVVASITAGDIPGLLALTPDGLELWAADYLSTSASVIGTASGKVISSIPLGNQSFGIAFAAQ